MSGSKSSYPGAEVPAEPLGLTVHAMPAPRLLDNSEGQSRTWRGRWKMLGVALACALPVLASYFTYYVVRPQERGAAYSRLIYPPVPMPELTATALQGQAVQLRTLQGQWLLVVVGGSSCDSACEQRLFMQRQLREMTGRERSRIDKLWLITDEGPLAPALQQALADTPAMHLLRLPRAAAQQWFAPEDGRALEDHLYIVDPMGHWMMRAPVNPDPARIKRDIDRLLRAAAGWDQPGRP